MYFRTINEGLGWKDNDCRDLLAGNFENNDAYMSEMERFMNGTGVTTIKKITPEGVKRLADEMRSRGLEPSEVLCNILNGGQEGLRFRQILGEPAMDFNGRPTKQLPPERYAAILRYIDKYMCGSKKNPTNLSVANVWEEIKKKIIEQAKQSVQNSLIPKGYESEVIDYVDGLINSGKVKTISFRPFYALHFFIPTNEYGVDWKEYLAKQLRGE